MHRWLCSPSSARRPARKPGAEPRPRALDPSGYGSIGGYRPAGLDVLDRDDPYEALVAVHDRQAPHQQLVHVLGDVLGVLILVAELRLTADHFFDPRLLRIATAGDHAHHDVAIGDHADQAIVPRDRERSDVAVRQGLGGLEYGVVRIDGLGVRGHHLGYFHLSLLALIRTLAACALRHADCIHAGAVCG